MKQGIHETGDKYIREHMKQGANVVGNTWTGDNCIREHMRQVTNVAGNTRNKGQMKQGIHETGDKCSREHFYLGIDGAKKG